MDINDITEEVHDKIVKILYPLGSPTTTRLFAQFAKEIYESEEYDPEVLDTIIAWYGD